MKKNKLDEGYIFDFELFGLVCPKKEYKLAWYLNRDLEISLQKVSDIRIEFSNASPILISNFKYEDDFKVVELLQNRLVGSGGSKMQHVLPEMKQFDYLLKLKDDTEAHPLEEFTSIIRDIPIVEYVMRLNFDTLKSKENLLY